MLQKSVFKGANYMISIGTWEDAEKLSDGNQIKGVFPKLEKSKIIFEGKNNILYCEEDVTLQKSILKMKGNNSVIYLGKSKYPYKLNISVFNDCVFHMGRNNYMNESLTAILSEQRHCLIGDDGVFSFGIFIRTADPHLIYKCETGERINPSKSVYIGDHVWIGQNCLILKGTQIDSGCIIGGMSVVAGKHILYNEVWAGNPVKRISDKIFWDRESVHEWVKEQTDASNDYAEYIEKYKNEGCTKDFWIYNYSEKEALEYSVLDEQLIEVENSVDRCNILLRLHKNKVKNRFAHSKKI